MKRVGNETIFFCKTFSNSNSKKNSAPFGYFFNLSVFFCISSNKIYRFNFFNFCNNNRVLKKKFSPVNMQSNYLGRQCQHPESVFGFLIKFMLSHPDAFSFACCLCPFYDCYKYFIGSYAAFQIVSLEFTLAFYMIQ